MNYALAKVLASIAYRELNDFSKADQYLKDAYLVVEMQHGEDNIFTAVILSSMGMLYKKQGMNDRAVDALQRALTIREKSLGESHPETIATRHNIAELLILQMKPEEAKQLLEKNMELMKQRTEEEAAKEK